MRISVYVAAFALVFGVEAPAGEAKYTCTIVEASVLSGDAKLMHDPKHVAIGQSFEVERKSGRTLGGPFSVPFSTLTVLDHKVANEHTYVVLTAVGHGGTADSLTIYESDDSQAKRFLAVVGKSVFTGVCK